MFYLKLRNSLVLYNIDIIQRRGERERGRESHVESDHGY